MTGMPIPDLTFNGGHALSGSDAYASGYFETNGGNTYRYAPFNYKTKGTTSEFGNLAIVGIIAFVVLQLFTRKKRK